VCCPDESFVHDRVSFIVDLEAPVIHEPGPGAFHDPSSWEDLEPAGVDLVDDLDTEVVVAAVIDEGGRFPSHCDGVSSKRSDLG
jgi:hypothetical protein